MTDTPLVSIIITSYNYGDYVRQAIESALRQTYAQVEVIVIDDGSTDISREIIESFRYQVHIVFQDNGGQAAATNAGFAISQGDIIIFLDSDDVLAPGLVAEVVAVGRNIPFSKVHWRLREIDATGKDTGKELPQQALAEGSFLKNAIYSGPLATGGPPNSPPTSGNAWSRHFLSQVMPIPAADYRTSSDQYLHTLSAVYGECIPIEKVLGCYRAHGANYSHHHIEKYAEEYKHRFEVTAKHLQQHLLKLGHQPAIKNWSRDSFYHQVAECLRLIRDHVPEGSAFFLVDGNEWGIGSTYESRTRHHLVERDHAFDGHPADDEDAITRLQVLISQDVEFIFFIWTNHWYLEFYPGLRVYLDMHFKKLDAHPLITGYQLLS